MNQWEFDAPASALTVLWYTSKGGWIVYRFSLTSSLCSVSVQHSEVSGCKRTKWEHIQAVQMLVCGVFPLNPTWKVLSLVHTSLDCRPILVRFSLPPILRTNRLLWLALKIIVRDLPVMCSKWSGLIRRTLRRSDLNSGILKMLDCLDPTSQHVVLPSDNAACWIRNEVMETQRGN